MKSLTLEDIRQAVAGRWLHRGATTAVTGVTTDSRHVKPGELFVALRGERFDAHEFLSQVAAAGAVAAIVQQDAPLDPAVRAAYGGGLIGVADTTAALGKLGAWYRTLRAAKVIAVTGSNGKTTVKRMIHHILAKHLRGTCSPKSFNNNIGVPLTLLGIGQADDYVVCELGSNAPGEIAALAEITQPHLAVITSVGNTHLEKLGSLAGVAAEKASLLRHLRNDGAAVLWADSDELTQAAGFYTGRRILFGAADHADLRLTEYHAQGLSQRFQINGQIWVSLPLPGRHNALNALAAIATAQQMGLTCEQAAADLADFSAVDGRLQAVPCGTITLIHDAYNANPSSVLAAADVLADCGAKRRVMIVGDMRELGESSAGLHESTGRQIGARGIELVVGVGALGRHVARGAAQTGLAAREFESVDQAQQAVGELLQVGDWVLIKGSRAMAMENLIDPIRQAMAVPSASPRTTHTTGAP